MSEGLLIDGTRVPAGSGRTFDSVNPATGAVFRAVAEAGAEDVDRAVRAAARAFDDRGQRSPTKRAKVLFRFADLLDSHVDELGVLETRDMGMASATRAGASATRPPACATTPAPSTSSSARRSPSIATACS